MVMPNDNEPPRRRSNLQRINSRTGWTPAIAIILILIGVIFFLDGRGTSTNTGEHPPNPTTQTPPTAK